MRSLFLSLTLGLWGVHAFAGTITYTESSGTSSLTGAQTCNSISALSGLTPRDMDQSGATSGTSAVSISNSSTQELVFYSPASDPNQTSWASGTYTVKLNVTVGDSSITWQDTCIIRVNSSGTAQATVGSLTAQNISLTAAGVQSMAITGSSQTANAGDRVAVVLNLKSANAHGAAHSVTVDFGSATNDTVATPLAGSSSFSFSPSASDTLTTGHTLTTSLSAPTAHPSTAAAAKLSTTILPAASDILSASVTQFARGSTFSPSASSALAESTTLTDSIHATASFAAVAAPTLTAKWAPQAALSMVVSVALSKQGDGHNHDSSQVLLMGSGQI